MCLHTAANYGEADNAGRSDSLFRVNKFALRVPSTSFWVFDPPFGIVFVGSDLRPVFFDLGPSTFIGHRRSAHNLLDEEPHYG